MPDTFVPLAERTGLIRPLGRYVLEHAVRQCARWRAENLDLQVAVNLTMPDLLDLDQHIADPERGSRLQPRLADRLAAEKTLAAGGCTTCFYPEAVTS